MRNPARERSRNLNREVWESPSVYGGEDVNIHTLCFLSKKLFFCNKTTQKKDHRCG
ncbi:unknown protein [Microcystis aeruginosa NIES-843]|uniref:Uncharacterized protein n=1 Tax=Microcystis aeruginosa (strain NIES-843 / IAM M-2473) TaxID=449447 RepID=B0JLP9_MICAN|nr:unknown protein [Microcystis aeruginosa NIES-843]